MLKNCEMLGRVVGEIVAMAKVKPWSVNDADDDEWRGGGGGVGGGAGGT